VAGSCVRGSWDESPLVGPRGKALVGSLGDFAEAYSSSSSTTVGSMLVVV